jgi:NhaP-type Na+/H+ or K+/H+ antiporter
LEFTERIEKLMEVGTILLLGSLLRLEPIRAYVGQALLIAGLLIFIIRPIGAWFSTMNQAGNSLSNLQLQPITRWLLGWFGIRGVGSLYYLSYALSQGITEPLGNQLTWITYLTVVVSVILHGITATPLMTRYEQIMKRHQLQQCASTNTH